MDKQYNVTNRSNSQVIYTIPELNLRREFMPRETKRVSYDELEKLSYRPGGMVTLSEYLQVEDIEALDKLNMKPEREYHLNHDQVATLLMNSGMDEFLDCLDFAPEGVIEIIKDAAVKLPLNDMAKREAILEKTGFNVTKAIENSKVDIEEKKEAPQRRVSEEASAPTRGRRAQTSVLDEAMDTTLEKVAPTLHSIGSKN